MSTSSGFWQMAGRIRACRCASRQVASQPITSNSSLLRRAGLRHFHESKLILNSSSKSGKLSNKSSSSKKSSDISVTSSSSSNTLAKFLAETINATGPISLANYMKQCLTNPTGGYYINKDPFGAGGDFVTSPEISQMFGELVGIWVLAQWMSQGQPAKFRLVEFGPGRGTLMDDLLRAARSFPQFNEAIKEIYMIEASPTLRNMQKNLLCGDSTILNPADTGFRGTTKWNNPIFWYDNVKELPRDDIATFIIAHEFFDALPILQFEHTENGWRERVVDCTPFGRSGLGSSTGSSAGSAALAMATSSNNTPVRFHMTINPHWTPSSKIVPQTHERYSKLPVGSRVEICPEGWDVSAQMADVIANCGVGGALIIDYGSSDTVPVDSLRAIKDHKIVSPFSTPGEADLSTDVDFQALKIAAQESCPVDVHGPVTQADWLHTMGIGARATALANSQESEDGKIRISEAYNRLVSNNVGGMGKIYKVMAITPQGSPVPVGFGGDVV
ncbi:hypothetical protein AWJ20_4435 [Sugiyamaella lignohabitans]|uniref:Protein arginine methyltransferase NDUFAF7 n=1 Tax=Sugiyamaella lignohabitans TaxID=796027 RepID=A0A167CFA2_9ASCO|nr:uncharacterized protein AWJ20_4435 [Sugiyamaella lignohabitans]ANB11614.1 hypothetical protein AWJ20_4435 [Sugiyamaella lignohabitans]